MENGFSRRDFFRILKPDETKASLIDEKEENGEIKLSRRDVLKSAGIVAGSLALDQIGIKTAGAVEKPTSAEEKEKIKIDWEKFIYKFCKEDPKQVEKLKEILIEIWGNDFHSDVDFYDKDEFSSTFISAGKYSFYSNTIKFNRFVLGETIKRKEPFRFLNTIFHESAHADFERNDYYFLKNIANELEMEESETFDVLRHSKILKESKRENIKQNVLANQIINEIYAAFGEIYASLKINEKYSFPLEEFLASQAIFNKINNSIPEEKEASFYKPLFERSKYFSVEYLSLLLMKDFEYDLEKVKSFMKKSDFKTIASEIFNLYYKYENDKLKKMGVDFENKIPANLYQKMSESDSEILKKEEETMVDFFREFSQGFSTAKKLKNKLIESEVEKLQSEGVFKQLSVHVFDEIIALKNCFETDIEKEINEISPEEKELLKAIKNTYLAFLADDSGQEEVKNEVDNTAEKLKTHLAKESFVAYADRIKKEIANIYEIYRNIFGIEGGI
jgi:hypothetical protein